MEPIKRPLFVYPKVSDSFSYIKLSEEVKDPHPYLEEPKVGVFAHSFKMLYRNSGQKLLEGDPDLIVDSFRMKFGERLLVGTGLKIVPEEKGYRLQINPVDGRVFHNGLIVTLMPVSKDFLEELCISIVNVSVPEQTIYLKEKIAELNVVSFS